jgi:hypothetical protein
MKSLCKNLNDKCKELDLKIDKALLLVWVKYI